MTALRMVRRELFKVVADFEEAASEMAGRIKAELLGLFVEDNNLLRLAGLPSAREVGIPSTISRKLDIVAMERASKVAATQTRQAIITAASCA
jgi:hypothetical protein